MKKPTLNKLSDLKPDSKNPRGISSEAFVGLKNSIEEYGDISGITINVDGTLISGHQRITALKEEYGNLDIKGNNIILPNGNTFPIRTVNWDKDKALTANIAANNQYIAGSFTPDLLPILEEIEIETPELFVELNLEPLKFEIEANVPEEPEKPEDEQVGGTEWVVFQLGEIKTVIPRIVADLLLAECDRVKPVVGSEEMGPLIECITANSSNTPIKSLE